jgi:DNA-binding CsgD family transcriptional regulator
MRFDDALCEVIGAIGAPAFPALAAAAVTKAIAFDLSTVVVHRDVGPPRLLFDDFDAAGGRAGIANYVAATHRLNPMLAAGGEGAFRAGDFAIRPRPGDAAEALLVRDPDEELGFRTRGWPPGLEEVGLAFHACGGLVELCCYRPRGSGQASPMDELEALRAPLRAAFRRHGELTAPPAPVETLTARESEILDLLLSGCASEAIALRLGISRYTVKDHRKHIFRKLSVGSLAELFALHRRA